MSKQKTFRLGGAGGYSIRAVGFAPERRDQKPVYESIQLWSDELGEPLFDLPLTTNNAADACAAVSAAGSLGDEDVAFLCGHIEGAVLHRPLGRN